MIGVRQQDSFARRIRVTIILTSVISVLVASMVFVYFDYRATSSIMSEDLHTLTILYSAGIAPSMIFQDKQAAKEILTTLLANPKMQSAAIFDQHGDLFTSWRQSDDLEIPSSTETSLFRFGDKYLTRSRLIILDGENLGTLVLRAHTRELQTRLTNYSLVVSVIILLAFLASFFLSNRLQRGLFLPIQRLAVAARKVSLEQDYNVHVVKESSDEIGVLTDAFNNMLLQIQERDSELRKTHEELENRVEIRTHMLQKQVNERIAAETRLSQSEEQLRHSQKMDAIGRLAGGISHDFNNILTAISGYAEMLATQIPQDNPLHRYATEIKRASERAASLTRQLLAVSRKQVLDPKVFRLCGVITGFEKMLRRLIPENVILETEICTEHCPVRADPGQIELVVMNLVVNARDAMRDGGTIALRSKVVHHRDELPNLPPEENREHWCILEVADTGCGIPPKLLDHIFEPFFTTKAEGKGTGLGLSTAYGIVRQSDGYLFVASEPDQGTTFQVVLPMVDEEIDTETAGDLAVATLGGNETILVVEDEPYVRDLVLRVLETAGYKVLSAEDGIQGLKTASEHDGPIDLLVSDLVMPNMNGRELSRELTKTRPEIKVLFISGYTNDLIQEEGHLEPGMTFLQKPFTPTVLRKKIREILD